MIDPPMTVLGKTIDHVCWSVGKGEPMNYEAPRVEVLGQASELIQASCGPRVDGDGYLFTKAVQLWMTRQKSGICAIPL